MHPCFLVVYNFENLHGMSIVQYRTSPTVADDADEPSWLTVLSSDDTTKDGVTMSWVVTSMLKYIKKILTIFMLPYFCFF